MAAITSPEIDTKFLRKKPLPLQPRKLWVMVKEIEESKSIIEQEYSEAKTTMIGNFGNNGWNTQGLISHTDSLVTMILKVFNHYDDKLKGVKK